MIIATTSRRIHSLAIATEPTPSAPTAPREQGSDSSFEPASIPGLPGSIGPALPAAQASATWVGVSAAKRVDEWCALGRELAAARAMPPSAARTARIEATQAALTRLTRSIDGAALMATLRSAAGDRRLGFMVLALGVEPLIALGQQRNINVNDALAMSSTVSVRGLTTYEARQVEKMFGSSLDPNTVRFNFTMGLQTSRAGALVMGNTINVDPSDRRWGFVPGTTLPADPTSHGEYNEVLLAHEMTHVWSYQHRGSLYAVDSLTNQAAAISAGGDRNGAYGYVPNRASIHDFNEEQRAMVVQDYRNAQAAVASGATKVWLAGQATYADPNHALSTLQHYIDELRAAGPGQPQPGNPPTYACTCHRNIAQDGVLGLVGSNADAVLASAGPAITNALQSGDVGGVAIGVFGVGVAIGASLLRREQQGSGGGSDVFDQAGLPRGVTWNLQDPAGTAASFSVRGAWEAQTGEFGIGAPVNPRIELDGSVRLPTDHGAVAANAAITVGAGGVQDASVGVRVDVADTTITVNASAQLASSAASRTDTTVSAQLGVASGDTSFSVGGSLRSDSFGIANANVSVNGDVGSVSFGAGASFVRTDAGPLWLTGASASVSVSGDAFSIDAAARATFVNNQLNSLSIEARLALTSLSVELGVSIEHLLTNPSWQASLNILGDWGSVRAFVQQGGGATRFGIGFGIPIP
jgi:hypothetical protein